MRAAIGTLPYSALVPLAVETGLPNTRFTATSSMLRQDQGLDDRLRVVSPPNE